MQTAAGVYCPAASRTGHGGHAAIVKLQVFAGQHDLTASTI